jgi:allantoate deiminase
MSIRAKEVIDYCRALAECSEEPGVTTRTFLSEPMREVHARLRSWMDRLGMSASVDAAGNLRGVYPARLSFNGGGAPPVLLIGSHLDTVPGAGAFDGVLGVVLALALLDLLDGHHFPFSIEVVGFSDEEGVRFGVPFIGSRALVGAVHHELLNRRDAHGCRLSDAIRRYGLDPDRIHEARVGADVLGYLEFHIEQGPVLDKLGLPLGIVDAIAGQSRLDVVFVGAAGHAGTTPMAARRDALAAASEWIGVVEREARATPGLVATVGRVDVQPGAANVIAGRCRASLDVRHVDDRTRTEARDGLVARARQIALGRGLEVECESRGDQATVLMHPWLVSMLERSVERSGFLVYRLSSGAGHDAMILADHVPAAMLFLRSPGGVSHHPDESVIEEDVTAALAVGRLCLEEIADRLPPERGGHHRHG